MTAMTVTMSVNSSSFAYFPSAKKSSFARTPKMEIPTDKVSRPAVIGLSGTCGSYPNSASAIKEILISVLKTSDGVKPRTSLLEHVFPVTELQGGHMVHWEDNNDGDVNEDVKSNADFTRSVCKAQNDVRLVRNKASWDNTQSTFLTSQPRNSPSLHPCYSDAVCTQTLCKAQNDIRFTRNRASWDNAQSTFPTSLPRNSPSQHPCYSDAVCTETLCKAQNDIRFTRNRASWDNTQSTFPTSVPRNSPTRHSRLSKRGFTPTLNGFSQRKHAPLKCRSFTDAGGFASVVPQVPTLSTDSERTFGSFSSLHPPGHHFKHRSHVSTFKQVTASQPNFGTSCTPPHPAEDVGTFHRRSQSFPTIQQAVDTDLVPSAESMTQSDASQGLFRPTVDLEKENEHFFVADLIIAAFEKLKCSLQCPVMQHLTTEGKGLLSSFQTDVEERCYIRHKTQSESATSTDSGYEGCAVLQLMPTTETISEQDDFTCPSEGDTDDEFEVIEFEDYEKAMAASSCSPESVERSSFVPGSNSAEVTAQQLYRTFRRCWLETSAVTETGSLITTKHMFVNKEDIPKEFESSVNLVEEIKLKSKLRGSFEWAPPRFQIIFNIHPSLKRDDVVAAQKFRCAGCGTKVEPKYNRRLRYCDYLGKYFCDCCHSYAESSIPARILMKWDFSKYYVCNFAKQLIESIWLNPTFDLLSVNPTLYTKVKELERVREHQEHLIYLKKLLKTCRLSESTLKSFEQVPCSLTEEQHMFSLDDLEQVKRGLFLPLLKDLLKTALLHVDNCELCQAKGFICEFCRSSDVLFPFQTAVAKRCNVCRTCFHKQCFKPGRDCPKCQRKEARQQFLRSSPVPE